jgi:hypothetical protein
MKFVVEIVTLRDDDPALVGLPALEPEAKLMNPYQIAKKLVECDLEYANEIQQELYNLLWDTPGYLSQAQMNEEQGD